jgi:N-acetylneuraminic acid mutarotase
MRDETVKDKSFINLHNRILLYSILFVLMFLNIGCSETGSNKPATDECEVSKDITSVFETEETGEVTEMADSQVWTKLSDMSTPRCSPGMAAINDKIYAMGGWNLQDGLNTLGSVEEYDPETDTWTNKADMKEKRYNFGIAALNGYLYTICGSVRNTDPGAANLYTGSSTVEKYDPETDQWIKVQSTNGSSAYAGSAAVGDKIYVLYLSGSSMVVEEYNPETDRWVMKSGKTGARYGFATAVVNNIIYLIGGTDAEGYKAVKTVDQYDPETDTWSSKPDLTNARAEHTAAVSGNKIYIIGGWNDTADNTFLFEEYDPKTGTCIAKTTPVSDKKTFQSSVNLNNLIYVSGGMTFTIDKSFQVYNPGR